MSPGNKAKAATISCHKRKLLKPQWPCLPKTHPQPLSGPPKHQWLLIVMHWPGCVFFLASSDITNVMHTLPIMAKAPLFSHRDSKEATLLVSGVWERCQAGRKGRHEQGGRKDLRVDSSSTTHYWVAMDQSLIYSLVTLLHLKTGTFKISERMQGNWSAGVCEHSRHSRGRSFSGDYDSWTGSCPLVSNCLFYNRHSLWYTRDDYKFLLTFPWRGGVQSLTPWTRVHLSDFLGQHNVAEALCWISKPIS